MIDEEIIEKMTTEEKVVFLQCFLFLIKADDKVDGGEKELLGDIIKLYGLSKNHIKDIDRNIGRDALLDVVKNGIKERYKALFLIKELLMIANVDNDMGDGELEFIEEIAKALHIESDKVLAINDLIMQRMMWLFKYKVVMETGSVMGE